MGHINPQTRRKYEREYSQRPAVRVRKLALRSKARRKIRLQVIQALGSKCKKCGFKDIRALQIDHINGGGHREALNLTHAQLYKKILAGEMIDYQCLCANCNWIKRDEEGETR
jgi:predicted HNH restriction endonuclease